MNRVLGRRAGTVLITDTDFPDRREAQPHPAPRSVMSRPKPSALVRARVIAHPVPGAAGLGAEEAEQALVAANAITTWACTIWISTCVLIRTP